MSDIEIKVRREVLEDIIVREIEAKDDEIRRLRDVLAEWMRWYESTPERLLQKTIEITKKPEPEAEAIEGVK